MVVYILGVGLIVGVAALANGRLQTVNGARVKEMGFPAFAVLVTAAHRQRLAVDRPGGKGVAVAGGYLGGQRVQPHPLNAGRGAGEVRLNEAAGQPNRLKNLCPPIGLNGGNAHFGHHFDDAFNGRFDKMGHRFFVTNARDHLPL